MNPLVAHLETHSKKARVDEEALAQGVAPATRRARGVYYSPAAAVDAVLARVARHVPPKVALSVLDPACGHGAFLAAAALRWPRAQLLGLELSAAAARACAARLPGAAIARGDALKGQALERLCARVPEGAFEVWVGNPPYNGRSPLLRDAKAYARVRALLPPAQKLPPGTSLRDDFAFFLLRAAERLRSRRGCLAFITSATLLDAFLYAPLRRALCEALCLEEVVELPPGTFQGTRVRACATVWTSPGPTRRKVVFGGARFLPGGDAHALRPEREDARALDARWTAAGEPLTALVPVHFPGLKTRFDELLVDDDPDRLLARVEAFLRCRPAALPAFARAHGLGPALLPKLAALKAWAPHGLSVDASRVRPFLRYRGPRGFGASGFCYLERALIPRGDHRLRGAYDPHATFPKLAFNVRELPLHAAIALGPGCVTAYRHARFAPLYVPACALEGGAALAAKHPTDAPALNLSPRGRAWARGLGEPLEAFRRIAAFVGSPAVQELWAPAFGTRKVLPVPFETL